MNAENPLFHACLTAVIFLSPGVAAPAAASEPHWHEKPHHLSLLLGGAYEDGEEENENAELLGIDYEYRVSDFLGVGAVVERAFNPLDTTTALIVADLHIWRGLIVQAGPGVEFIDRKVDIDGVTVTEDKDEFVVRVGALYEFERGHFTISPQLHVDITDESETIIFGLALGFAF